MTNPKKPRTEKGIKKRGCRAGSSLCNPAEKDVGVDRAKLSLPSEIPVPIKEETNPEGYRMVQGSWGYACLVAGKIWIPVINGDMKEIVSMLVNHFKTNKVVFSAVLNPETFKLHLKNIVREWDDWFEEMQDYSHCIEVEWI